MNLLFFLTPKSEVTYAEQNNTMRQVMERMARSGYSAIPVIDETGHYVRTVTDGEVLAKVNEILPFDKKKAIEIPLEEIPCRRENLPVSIQSDMEDLMSKVINQNFVPVVDDHDIFIGIITRKDVIQYLHRKSMKE